MCVEKQERPVCESDLLTEFTDSVDNMYTYCGEIDNLELIKPLLKFEDEDNFYFIQILKRKKENPKMSSNSKVVKEYFVDNLEYLEQKYDEIKTLCKMFNARASIRLNRRSYERCAFGMMSKLSNKIMNKDFKMSKLYSSVCGSYTDEPEKKWIVDLDGSQASVSFKYSVMSVINSNEPFSVDSKVLAEIPSKNGLHLITRPFNIQRFRECFPDVDIHKDNPTNLFIP